MWGIEVKGGAYPAPEPGEEACCWLCTSSTARRMLVAVRRLRWLAAMASLCSCVSSRPDSADATLADVSCTHPTRSPSAQGLAAARRQNRRGSDASSHCRAVGLC